MAAKLGGAKGDKYSIGQNSDINVTPFVDVMLVLLIIFMVSIPAATVAIKVDLPPAANTPMDPRNKPVFISIRDNGTLQIVPTGATTLATLDYDLQKALQKPDPKKETILIRADRYVRYGDFMSVVNTLQGAGYYHVSLILENIS
jgi:biopolymer transport protein ExbD